MCLSGTVGMIRVILLFESVFLVNGAMQAPHIQDIAFYNDFKDLPSLRCSKVYGTGTQSDRLIGSDQTKRATLKNSLKTDGQKTLVDSLDNSPDHEIGIFTIDELRSIIVYMTQTLDATGLQTYLTLRASWDSVTEEQILAAIQTWPPLVHLIMKEELMCDTIRKMNEDALKTLCLRLAEASVTLDTVLEYLDRCGYCAGIAARNKEHLIRVVGGYKAIALKKKLAQVDKLVWDVHMLMLVPDALETEDILFVASTDFCNVNQMQRLVNTSFYPYLTRDVKVTIAERIRECMDMELRSWGESSLKTYAPYIIYLLTETLKSEFSGAMEKLKKLFVDLMGVPEVELTDFFRAVAPFVREYWSQESVNMDDATKALFFCAVIKYDPDDAFISSVTHNDLTVSFSNLDSCNDDSLRLTAEELAPVVERYISDTVFVWDDTSMERLRPLMGKVSVSIIMDISSLCGKWTTYLKDIAFPRNVLMKLWNKCQDHSSIGLNQIASWTCTNIKNAGTFITMMKLNQITTIPMNALYDCADYLENIAEQTGICKLSPGLCGAVLRRIKEYISSSGTSMVDFVNNIGPALFNALDLQASDFTFEDIESFNIQQLDVQLAGVLWDIVQTKKGDLSSDNTAYTSQTFAHISGLFALGATTTDLQKLPEDDGLYSVLSDMAGQISSMSGKKMEIILDKLMAVFGITSNSKNVCVEEALLREVGMFFARANVSVFAKLNSDSLKAVFKTIGQRYKYIRHISPPRMRNLLMIMLRFEGIKDANTFTDGHVGKYGPFLWCGMTKTMAEKLDSLALATYITQLARCIHFDSATKAALVLAVKNSGNYNFQERPDMIVNLGHFLIDYIALSTDAKSTIVNAIVANPWTRKYITFKISLYIDEISQIDVNVIGKTQRTTYSENKIKLLEEVFNYFYNDGGSGRRKRNAGAVTCAEIKSYKGHLEFLTQAMAEAMSTRDVVDCLSEFQRFPLSSDVVTVLLNKLKTTDGYGDLSTWTSGEIASVGALLDGLTLAELKQLTFSDEVIASVNRIQFQQSADIITAYLEDTSVSDTSTIDQDTLSLMGTLLCGYSVSDLTAMDKTAAFNAAKHVCNITCLTTEQLTAFGANIASHVGNNWSTVEPYVIESMGVCMGGFPSTVLNTLTAEQVGNLQPAAVKSMPPTVFIEVFDASMMSHMSSDQANVVTAEQIAQMDSSQSAIFTTKLTLNEEDTSLIVTTGGGGGGGGGGGSGSGGGIPRAQQSTAVFVISTALLMTIAPHALTNTV